MTSRRLLAAVPLVWLAGALVCRLLVANAPLSLSADLQQPVPVVFGWRAYGLIVWAVFAAVWTGAVALAVRICAHAETASLRGSEIAAAVIASLSAALLWPAIASSDIYAYASFGVRTLGGFSPYGTFNESMTDALGSAAIWQWGATMPPDNYGPAFNALAAALVWCSRGTPMVTLSLFRISACVAAGVCCVLLWRLLHDRSPLDRRAAVCAFALNPLVVWSAAEGHNDFYAIAVVLAGLTVAQKRPLFGGLLTALAALFKIPALLAAGIMAAVWKGDALRFRMGTAIGAGIVLFASLSFFESSLHRVAQQPAHPTALLLYPWYATWFVPFLATLERTRSASLIASAIAVVAYVPDMYGSDTTWLHLTVSAITLAAFTPVVRRLSRSGSYDTNRR